MIRSAQAFALLVVFLAPSAAQAGLTVTANAAVLPGTTVLFDLTYVSGLLAEINTIGPRANFEFMISATGTGTDPDFTTSGEPTLVGDWKVAFDPTFITTFPDPDAPAPATFGQLSVDIPANFDGSFELSPTDDFDVIGLDFGGTTDTETILGTSTFEFTTVPEPGAFMLLGLLCSGIGGVRYLRKRLA